MKKLLFILFLFPLGVWAQKYSLQANKDGLQQVEQITNLIYNNQHQEVQQQLKQLESKVPVSHPVFPMLRALNLYWLDAPMHTASPHFEEFTQHLRQTVKQSETYLERAQDETMVNFMALSAHSLLTRFHADRGNYLDAVGEAKNAYSYMKKGFDLASEYKEFYFPVGLYNYYREKYPELHPVYKPFMFFFRSGDKAKGLQQLEQSARQNIFTKPEAGVFLAHIYLYYENKPSLALQSVQQLHEEFPENRLFRVQLVESLLATGSYAKALPHIKFLLQQQDSFYLMAGQLFQGLYNEKALGNSRHAQLYYQKALKTAESLNYMANVYRSMAYAGQGRYYVRENDKSKARAAYEKALNLASYEYPVKPEAEAYLQ
jgi:tetratricopeptide (TPR) repeat protein